MNIIIMYNIAENILFVAKRVLRLFNQGHKIFLRAVSAVDGKMPTKKVTWHSAKQ